MGAYGARSEAGVELRLAETTVHTRNAAMAAFALRAAAQRAAGIDLSRAGKTAAAVPTDVPIGQSLAGFDSRIIDILLNAGVGTGFLDARLSDLTRSVPARPTLDPLAVAADETARFAADVLGALPSSAREFIDEGQDDAERWTPFGRPEPPDLR